jgi:hypothetical protein
MTRSRYDSSAVRTLESGIRPPDAHSWALTDAESGVTRGMYASEQLALQAVLRSLVGGSVTVLTVLHPDGCRCPEVNS